PPTALSSPSLHDALPISPLSGFAVNNPSRWLLMLALVLAAINLRPGITSFAPLIERIAEALDLSRGLVSLTTALPVLLMGLLAPDRKSTRLNSSHVKISY